MKTAVICYLEEPEIRFVVKSIKDIGGGVSRAGFVRELVKQEMIDRTVTNRMTGKSSD